MADPDVDAWFAMYGDPEVTRFIGGTTMLDRRAARSFLEERLAVIAALPEGLGAGAIVRHHDGRIVGSALIKPLPGKDREVASEHIEIGWHLAKAHWGQGYATEAGQALATHAFTTLALDHVLAVVEVANTASQAVARRIGMRRLGRSRDFYGGLEVETFRLDAPVCT